MHDTLTDAEKAELLSMAGLTADHAQAFTTPTPVIETVLSTKAMQEGRNPAAGAPTPDSVVMYDDVAADLLKKAKGNLDTAKQLSENWAKAEFDKVKLSKIQAAQAGVDRTEHNKAAWAKVQTARQYIEAQVRKGLREGAPTVRGKIAASKAQANPDLDAFLLKHGDDDKVREMAKLMGLSA